MKIDQIVEEKEGRVITYLQIGEAKIYPEVHLDNPIGVVSYQAYNELVKVVEEFKRMEDAWRKKYENKQC